VLAKAPIDLVTGANAYSARSATEVEATILVPFVSLLYVPLVEFTYSDPFCHVYAMDAGE
jgi:hypothetical protein